MPGVKIRSFRRLGIVSEVTIREGVSIPRGIVTAAEMWSKVAEGSIDRFVRLPVELLQNLFPGSRLSLDQIAHRPGEFGLIHDRHVRWWITEYEHVAAIEV
jgi:hypothetical protein